MEHNLFPLFRSASKTNQIKKNRLKKAKITKIPTPKKFIRVNIIKIKPPEKFQYTIPCFVKIIL